MQVNVCFLGCVMETLLRAYKNLTGCFCLTYLNHMPRSGMKFFGHSVVMRIFGLERTGLRQTTSEWNVSKYVNAVQESDYARGRGRDIRQHIFAGFRLDLFTRTNRAGNARDWERSAV
jgi:hypothetical protein